MGWNQILSERFNKDVIGQYWKFGKKMVKKHLEKGGNIVFSKFGSAYLDYSYKFTSLRKAYIYEPIPKKLHKEFHNNVLGIEAPMWTEWVRNIRELDWQTFPRLIAYAETGWTPSRQKNFKSFKNRLENLLNRLDIFGVYYAKKEEYQPHFLRRIFGFFTILREPKRISLHKLALN
jgi:hexosaminidase